MNRFQNRLVICLLAGGIVTCCALMPWGRLFGSSRGPDEGRLTARIAQYVELRRKDDWPAIYAIVDPRQRETVPIVVYLGHYGTGALKVHDIQEKSRVIDAETGVASVVMSLDGEMVLAKIDPRARRGLRSVEPKDLRRQGEFTTQWSWRDGEWWLSLDREMLTGRTNDGRQIRPAGSETQASTDRPGPVIRPVPEGAPGPAGATGEKR